MMGEQPDTEAIWVVGERFDDKEVNEPIRCSLDPKGGPDLPDAFLDEEIPLFSDRLIEALRKAGVDNLSCYDTELFDPSTGKTLTNYKATNIVGKIECTDLNKSTYDPASDVPMLEFEQLVVNERKARDAKMFRLAENPMFILVSDPVKNVIYQSEWIDVRIIPLEDPDAY